MGKGIKKEREIRELSKFSWRGERERQGREGGVNSNFQKLFFTFSEP
jgi:hypothetical protein